MNCRPDVKGSGRFLATDVTRRLLITLAPVLLLAAAGCISTHAYDPATGLRLDTVRFMTKSDIGNLTRDVTTPTTHEVLTLSGYGSQSQVTGADVANILGTVAAAVLKGLGVP